MSARDLASEGPAEGNLRWVSRRFRPQRSLGAHGAARPGTGSGSRCSLCSPLCPCSASAPSRLPSATARRPPGGTARVRDAYLNFYLIFERLQKFIHALYWKCCATAERERERGREDRHRTAPLRTARLHIILRPDP